MKPWMGVAAVAAAMLFAPSAAFAGPEDPALLKFHVPSADQYDDFEALGLDMNHEVDKNADGSITVQAWVTDEQLAWVRAQGYPQVGVVHDKFNIDHIRAAAEAEALRCLRGLIPRDSVAPGTIGTAVEEGEPYRWLLRKANEVHADLIVMGVRGRNAVDLTVFGSTANHVVREATCPVLIVRNG